MVGGKRLTVVLVVSLGIAGLILGSRLGATPVSHDQDKLQRLQQAEDAQRASSSKLPAEPVPVKTPRKIDRPETPVRPERVAIPAGSGIKNAGRISSAWFVDYYPNDDQTAWDPIYMYAWRPTPESQTKALLSLKYPSGKNYVWESPLDVGEITIKDITGLQGVVEFTTTTGKSGTFNLQSETWRLDQ